MELLKVKNYRTGAADLRKKACLAQKLQNKDSEDSEPQRRPLRRGCVVVGSCVLKALERLSTEVEIEFLRRDW